tara:strand:- start:740 stop:1780 length:1041 start_codon:yes stop_codon:yes gene_type:complete
MIPDHILIGKTENNLSKIIKSGNYSKVAFLLDTNTLNHCFNRISNSIDFQYEKILIDDGEENKNLETSKKVWDKLIEYKFDRKSILINLGGGVICDLGGFVASTFMRGIDFINIPTTLLSQVDASVGGKLGIDYKNIKNIIGVFKEPNKVIIDTNYLNTLSERELKSGYAEVIKHCLIRDKIMFDKIYNLEWTDIDWDFIINHSIKIKSDIVKKDIKENGLRKILNFGHTIGHAIETTYLNKLDKFLHGEAIAIGMICEAYISNNFNKLRNDELEKTTNYIRKVFNLSKVEYYDEIIKNAYFDKKNLSDKIRISSLKGIGNCEYDIVINEDIIIQSLDYYNLKCDG